MKIQDIIFDFKNKFGLSGLWSKPTSYMEYEDVTNKVESYLESSLTSLLDSLEKETREQGCYTQTTLSSGKKVNLISKEEIINIIKSHR